MKLLQAKMSVTSRVGQIVLIALVGLTLGGCEIFADYEAVELAQTPDAAQDATNADVELDAAADAAVDTGQPDAAADIGPDVAADVGVDASPDVGVDAPDRPIAIDIDFPGGSIDVASTTVTDELVELVGRENFYPGEWRWFAFRASNVAGKTPRFTIPINTMWKQSALTLHQMTYSTDGETWRFFENNEVDDSAGLFRFSNNSPFQADEVFVAFGIPYTPADVSALVTDIKQSRWVSPTASADADLVLGQSPGGTDDLGRTVSPHNIYGFQITDPSSLGSKTKIVLSAGVHANEPTGNHVLEGLVRWLVSDDADAAQLRQSAIVYVYPMINPDGYAAGYDRSSVADPDTDLNRIFDSSQWSGYPEVELVGGAMLADINGGADYVLDFHVAAGSGDIFAYTDANGDPTGITMTDDPFWLRVIQSAPVEERDASLGYDTIMKFGWRELGADFVATFEPYYQPGWTLDSYRLVGKQIGRGFVQ